MTDKDVRTSKPIPSARSARYYVRNWWISYLTVGLGLGIPAYLDLVPALLPIVGLVALTVVTASIERMRGVPHE